MAVYTIHEPVNPAPTVSRRAEEIVFVKEGFSWLAFLIGAPWLIIRGLWLEFLIIFAIFGVFASLFAALGVSFEAVRWIFLFLNLILGFEFHNLERWKLERKGYRLIGMVSGRDFAECERRFFEAWLPRAKAEWEMRSEGKAPPAAPSLSASAATGRPRVDEPIIGFLTTSER